MSVKYVHVYVCVWRERKREIIPVDLLIYVYI